MIRERFPTDVEKIFAEIKSVSKDMKDRREFQHVLLSVELHDMAVERDTYRSIAIEYCKALNKDLTLPVDREVMVDTEAKRVYKEEKSRIAEEVRRNDGNSRKSSHKNKSECRATFRSVRGIGQNDNVHH